MAARRERFRKPGRRAGWAGQKPDELAHLPLTQAMEAHFEWMLVASPTTPRTRVRGRRIALRVRFIYLVRRARGWPIRARSPSRSWSATSATCSTTASPTARRWPSAPARLPHPAADLVQNGWPQQNRILLNPAIELALPHLAQAPPRKQLLGVAEVEAILTAADPASPEVLRDRAMLEVLYSTGLRRTELARLNATMPTLLAWWCSSVRARAARIGWCCSAERAALWLDKYLVESRPRLLGGRQRGACS